MGISIQQVAAAGRTEADSMKRAIASHSGDGQFAMSVGQFAKLATLIHVMAELLDKPHPGAFGDPRYWVPLDVLERECAELRRQTAFARPFPFQA